MLRRSLQEVDGIKKKDHQKEKISKPVATFWHQTVEHQLLPQSRNKKPHFTNWPFYLLLLSIVFMLTILSINLTENYRQSLINESIKVSDKTNLGIKYFNEGDLNQSLENFNQANESLKSTKIKLQESGQYINYLLYLPYADSKIIEASRMLTVLATVTQSVKILEDGLTKLISDQSIAKEENYLSQVSIMTGKIAELALTDAPKLADASNRLDIAEDLLKSSKSDNYSEIRGVLLSKIPELKKMVDASHSLYQILPTYFAVNGTRKYLLLFQNNSELRPAGGFLGSFAEADFKNGKLNTLNFQSNIYKLDQAYKPTETVNQPEEYSYISGAMRLRDSNYDYDFKRAMENTIWLYEEESKSQANGVVALDTTLITNLLKIVGPIKMPEYGLTIDEKNFLTEVEYQVEIGYFKDKNNWSENEPKKILAEMMPKLIKEIVGALTDNSKRQLITNLISDSLEGKHLLFYSKDNISQNYFEKQNWAGRVNQDLQSDYFFLSSANIGGLKSSLNIKEAVNHQVEFKQDGVVIHTVDLERDHLGSNTWPDGENKTYNKMILPVGSKILDYKVTSGNDLPYSDAKNSTKAGAKSYDEFNKTVIAFWQNTKSKEKSKITIKYQLPATLNFTDRYQLLIQKQPGTIPSNYQIIIDGIKQAKSLDGQLTNNLTFLLEGDSKISFLLE